MTSILRPSSGGISVARLEVLAELHDRCPGSHVVIVSAYASRDNAARARNLGAEECFDKLEFLGRIPGVMAHYSAPA